MSAPIIRQGWWAGRSGLVFPLVLIAFATYLLVGVVTGNTGDAFDSAGPWFFPVIVITAMYVFGILLAISLIRRPQFPVAEVQLDSDGKVHPSTDTESRWFSDWPRLAWAIGGFTAFVLLLTTLGWILSAGLLFWCVTRAFGSRHIFRNILVALVFASLLYLVFTGLLTVNLPSGTLFGGRI